MFKLQNRMHNWVALGVLVLCAVIFICVVCAVNVPKTPATAEQVWDVLVEQGYEPKDITEQIREKYPDTELTESVVVQNDDIDFQFYVFNSQKDAINIYNQLHSLFVTERRGVPYAEHDTRVANYRIYTLLSKGKYSVAIFVGNTAVYAYCDEENEGKVASILREIGYFKS